MWKNPKKKEFLKKREKRIGLGEESGVKLDILNRIAISNPCGYFKE